MFLLITGWLAIATAFSMWKGGSVQWLMDNWLISMVTFLGTGPLILSVSQYATTIRMLSFSAIVITLGALVFGQEVYGRLALPEGTLSNPNDLASLLLLGLPFWFLPLFRGGSGAFKKAIVMAGLGIMLITIFRTGSRGALITLGLTAAIVFARLSAPRRLLLAASTAVFCLFAIGFASENSRARMMSLFQSSDEIDTEVEIAAAGSKELRKQMLIESLVIMAQKPIFGVGPGMFSVHVGNLWEERFGNGLGWREAHNTYTQLGAEAGIPAMLMYIVALYWCLKKTRAVYQRAKRHPHLKELQELAFTTCVALAGYAVSALFASLHQNIYFHLLASLTVALVLAAEPELQRAEQGAAALGRTRLARPGRFIPVRAAP
jgi:O-antigen ligase